MPVRQDSAKTSSNWSNWAPRCGNPGCSTNSLLRALTRRRRGITIENGWYCSEGCFEQAVKSKLGELMTSRGKPTKAHRSRVPLGLLLLSRGILTSEQHRLALDHQRLTEVDFGAAVQHLGFATQEQVTAAVAAQWACPVFSMGDRPLETQIRIPRRLLELYEMLPVHYAEPERRLMIGFVRSVQHQALYMIEHITSCTAVPCFITAREYELHLDSPSMWFLRDYEVAVDEIVDATEMARLTTKYVIELGADKLRLGKCRDYLWARISGHEQEMDLLFRVRSD
jgi:hypothetical protein